MEEFCRIGQHRRVLGAHRPRVRVRREVDPPGPRARLALGRAHGLRVRVRASPDPGQPAQRRGSRVQEAHERGLQGPGRLTPPRAERDTSLWQRVLAWFGVGVGLSSTFAGVEELRIDPRGCVRRTRGVYSPAGDMVYTTNSKKKTIRITAATVRARIWTSMTFSPLVNRRAPATTSLASVTAVYSLALSEPWLAFLGIHEFDTFRVWPPLTLGILPLDRGSLPGKRQPRTAQPRSNRGRPAEGNSTPKSIIGKYGQARRRGACTNGLGLSFRHLVFSASR